MGFGPTSVIKSNPTFHKTNLSGQFTIASYIPYPQSSLAFTCNANVISKKTYGPFSIEPDSTFYFTAYLTDYQPTDMVNKPMPSKKERLKILMILQSDAKNISIIFSTTAYPQKNVEINIYSLSGVLINSFTMKS